MNKHTAEMIELAKEGLQIHRESNPEYKICAEVLRLNSLNAELLDSLRHIKNQSIGNDWTHEQAFKFCKNEAREAIAKATGESDE